MLILLHHLDNLFDLCMESFLLIRVEGFERSEVFCINFELINHGLCIVLFIILLIVGEILFMLLLLTQFNHLNFLFVGSLPPSQEFF